MADYGDRGAGGLVLLKERQQQKQFALPSNIGGRVRPPLLKR